MFDDPSTFLPKRLGILGRGLLALRRRRWPILAVLTVLLLTSYGIAAFLLPSYSHRVHPETLAVVNLKGILTTWIIQQYDRPQQTTFDLAAARQNMRPSLSPWSEGRAAWWRVSIAHVLRFAPYFVVPTIAYVLVAMIFIGKRMRRGAISLVLILLCILLCSIHPWETASWLCPGSHAFLDDYVYFPGVDLTRANEKWGETIAAYDIQSFHRPGRRIIGFADGHVVSLWDDRAKPLFEAQGLQYPVVKP